MPRPSPPPLRRNILNGEGRPIRPWAIWFTTVSESADRGELVEVTHTGKLRPGIGSQLNRTFFIASRDYQVIAIREIHSVAAPSGATLNIRKETSTQAPGGGVSLLSSTIDLSVTANTAQSGSLTNTSADLNLKAGDRLSLETVNATSGILGETITITLRAIG